MFPRGIFATLLTNGVKILQGRQIVYDSEYNKFLQPYLYTEDNNHAYSSTP